MGNHLTKRNSKNSARSAVTWDDSTGPLTIEDVDENKDIEVVFLNDATIKLKGIKPSIKISRPPAENVELEFTINRITGEFNVSWHSSPQQVDWSEKCEKIKMF
jgi:hypothetical protein